MDLLWFILAAYGLTQILVYGSIFNKIRPTKDDFNGLGELFHCPMCMGFWVGAFLFCVNGSTELFSFDYTAANFIICACLSSGTSYILCKIFDDDGVKVSLKGG